MKKSFALAFDCALLLLLIGVIGASADPDSPRSGGPKQLQSKARYTIGEDNVMRLSDEDRCPVCAMLVARHEKFACGMQLVGGETYYFCGTGCMFRAFLHPEHFLGTEKPNIVKVVVRDYFSGKPVNGGEVSFVAGSDVVGPMGPAIVSVLRKEDVEVFRKRHGGTRVFVLSDLNDQLWSEIRGPGSKKDH